MRGPAASIGFRFVAGQCPGVARSRWLCVLACWLALGAATQAAADEPPLHERIDGFLESATLGPVAGQATDADFLRRAYLDLNGTIPDAATARAFLDDSSPDKRVALVDRLLARPQFARHMAHVFDVMLMERRPQKSLPAREWTISGAEWHEYLRSSFAENKPLDQLYREILAADGVEPALRPAAKFYFDRDGDPNLLARDIGRLFFGRDLQCAQCHDHPLVDDYLQADYYGLMAFVNRGVMFDDAKLKKTYYAENADGEVNFKSVFTGEARDHVLPKLPREAPLSEPMLAKEEQYVVAPAKDVRPIPKYSRRAQLAATTTSGQSAAFNRNLANRLWDQMMGRGLAHPLDMQHSGNPPVQSELLALLADELVRMKFDVKAFLRELALTRAYGRASEMPVAGEAPLEVAADESTLAAWRAEAEKLTAELGALESSAVDAADALNAAYAEFSKTAAARDAAEKARAEVKKASDEVSAALAAAVKEVAAKDEIVKALVEARVKADAAVAKLPEDKALAEAAALFLARSNEVDTQLAAAKKIVSEKTPQVQETSLKLAEADKALAAATAAVSVAHTALDAADVHAREAQETFRASKAREVELAARMTDAQAVLDYRKLATAAITAEAAASSAAEQLAAVQSQDATTAEAIAQQQEAARVATEKAAADRLAATQAWDALADRATARFTLAALKPLSPEQLAWGTMQAVGLVDQQAAALAEQAKKDVEAKHDLTPEARASEEAKLLEARIDEKLRGNVGSFVSLFGQEPGQAPSFQATVHQALFLSNGGVLAGWLNPGGGNLTERLSKIEDPAAVGEELYLSILTRRPSAEEQARVAAYWEEGKADRAAAAREMVWGLLVSAEFRFNH